MRGGNGRGDQTTASRSPDHQGDRRRSCDVRYSMTTQTGVRRRVAELDGLRAFAILPVLATHFWSYPPGANGLNRVAAAGWVGVDLFFVLSGYLITGLLWDARRSPRYYGNFYGRRVLRIFPLYYALLVVVFAVLPLVSASPALLAATRDRWLYVTYLANVALVAHGWQLFCLDITWSLAVEEQFYLCWPLLIRRCSRAALVRLLLLLIVIMPILRTGALALGLSWRGTLMLTPFRLDTLAVGALIALAEREAPEVFAIMKRQAPRVAGLLGGFVAALILSGRFARDSWLVGTVGYSLLALFFGALLVVALGPPRPLRAILLLRPLRRVGVVSYGIYILHPLCYAAVGTILLKVGLPLTAAGTGSVVAGCTGLVIDAAAAYGVAEVSFRLFETPLLRLKRFFENGATESAPSEGQQALSLEA